MPNSVKQRHHRDNRSRKRKDYVGKKAVISAAVDGDGLKKLFRDITRNICAADNHVPYAHQSRKPHHPSCIEDAKTLHEQVRGDQTAAKPHGEGEKKADDAAAHKLSSGQDECRDQCNRNIQQRADDCIDERV